MKQTKHFQRLRQILIVAFLIITTTVIFSQSQSIVRLGIINPTPANLNSTLDLISNQLITADSLEIVGIYHEKQHSSIVATNKFIKEKGLDHITLRVIEGDLPIKNLFETNNCTSQFKDLFEKTDALIFYGGPDIPPSIYNEETFLTTERFDAGKNWELSFLHHLIGGSQSDLKPLLVNKPDFTILGICLGMQEMNVASGGSMYQDIPYQIYGKKTYESILEQDPSSIHRNYYNNTSNENKPTSVIQFHPIIIMPDAFLEFKEVSASPIVASAHHQAVKDLGMHFKVVSTSMDGKVVEALQHTLFQNVYGVQFHPEVSSIFEKGHLFKVTPDETMELNDNSLTFHHLFWKNFSERLK